MWKILFCFFCLWSLLPNILWDGNLKSHWNILRFCDLWTIMPDSSVSNKGMSDFVSLPFYALTFVIKMKCALWKNVWFCFISLVYPDFPHKIERLFYKKKKKKRYRFKLSCWEHCLISLNFLSLCSLLTKKRDDNFNIY